MTALSKTSALERVEISIELLDANPNNPNEMTEAEFNLLYDNFERTGFTDAVLVRKMPEGRFRIVGGHHRVEVAKLHDFTQVPCTVIDDPEFDDDQEAFQVVRMNTIRGKLSPKKFLKMYEGLSAKYAKEVMAEAFGFADEDQFNKLVGQMATALPKEMQADFKKAAKEIKTIDGLSKLLNSMFTKYGDTLDYGYMLLDFGGKDSVWLRMGNDTRKALLTLGKRCMTENRAMDDLLGGLVQLAASGVLESQLVQLIAKSPEVKSPLVDIPSYETGAVVHGSN